jgi:UDP-4-amino-4,6-dideoxy-N-acetyl-beta-L-altrosamine transaminase
MDRRKSQQNRKYIRVIPYGKQNISQTDIDSVVNVLQSDFLTQGPQVPLFEKTVSDYCDVRYGVAVNSATSALHIACLALRLGKGDWLWTSPNSFVASANCGLYCGAKVDFVDIDPKTYNLSTKELEKKLIQAKKDNKLPKIVIPVHFSGQSCDMKRIHSLGKEYGFKIIEDASHAIGGKYLDQPIGNCQYSDITVFSFHPVKIITTAEGGLATTNQPDLAERMQLFRSHGVTRDPKLITKEAEGGWHYQQVELGFNYRMTEFQAALGVSQMQRLDEFVVKRHVLQERYHELLVGLPLVCPYQFKDSYSSLHLYPVQIELDKIDKTRAQVYDALRENRLGVNVHYIPIHTQPYYQNIGFKQGDFPQAEYYYSRAISIPLFQGLTIEMQDEVVSVLKKVLA